MNTGRSSWLKGNKVWLWLTAYVTLHFGWIEFAPFILLKTSLAAVMTVLANRFPERGNGPVVRNLLICLFAVSIFLLDETAVPGILDHTRIRFLLPAVVVALLLITRFASLQRTWNLFLALNVVFLCTFVAVPATRNVKFKTEDKPSNRLYDSLLTQISKRVPVTLLLADGYPSDSTLEGRFKIRMILDSLLQGYSYQRFHSRYTSTPISISNLLFGAVFPKEDMEFNIRGRQTEVELVREALVASSLYKLSEGKNASWLSFIFEDGYSRLLEKSFWKRNKYLAVFDDIFFGFFNDINRNTWLIHRYNDRVLSDYRDALNEYDGSNRLIFIHLLTFHKEGGGMDEEMRYADSLILKATNLTPKNRKIILFSDHGYREAGLDGNTMRSGILMTSPDP